MHGSSSHVTAGMPNYMQAVGPESRLLTSQGAETRQWSSQARGLVPLHLVSQIFRLQLALHAQHLQGSHKATAAGRCYRCHLQAAQLQSLTAWVGWQV